MEGRSQLVMYLHRACTVGNNIKPNWVVFTGFNQFVRLYVMHKCILHLFICIIFVLPCSEMHKMDKVTVRKSL